MWAVDGSAGFAGNFTSDGTNAYWLDTEGHLWAAGLGRGNKADDWPAYSINLPAMIGATRAFTNTEPAVEVRQTPTGPETHLYVTLRNYSTQSGAPDLRAGLTGSDGAVVAIGPGGQLKWHRPFGPGDRLNGQMASLNTAPLAILSRGALLFGDVNGYLYSYALDSGNPTGGDPRQAIAAPGAHNLTDRLFLLDAGEQPARGPYTFSQVSGVGVDPVLANGLLLVGVNYYKDGSTSGRLVAYRTGEGYDLRWLEPFPSTPLPLPVEKPSTIEGQLQLDLTTQRLDQLCDGTIAVQWYLTDTEGSLVRSLGEVPLPKGLGPNQPHTVSLSTTLTASDPPEGQIIGVIDHPSVQALGQPSPQNPLLQQARRIAATLGIGQQRTCSGSAAEVVRRDDSPEPEAGLANNILRLPYTKQVVVDDPFIADLAVPQAIVIDDRFEVEILMGYQNSLGRSAVEVEYRLWARPDPTSPPPQGGWKPFTIDQIPCCSGKVGFFEGLPERNWEIIAEIRYPSDTNLQNNWVVKSVRIQRPPSPKGPGSEGGAISN